MSMVVFVAFDDPEEGARFLKAVQREKILGVPVVRNGVRKWRPAKLLVAYRSGIEEERLGKRR